MHELISVIVPIYKVEKYLRECLNSIVNQTYSNLEIILVDDGSPDNCGAICDEYAQKDPRVKVIHKSNGGLSDARNAGMKVMTGEYLMFVDSDDWLEPNAVELLYSLMMEHDTQLVIGSLEQFEDDTNRLLFSNCSPGAKAWSMSQIQAMEHMLRYGWGSWGKLYRMEIHRDIYFPVGEINEDEAIALNVLENCDKVIRTGALIYHYRCRPGSITTTQFSEKDLDWYKHCKADVEWVRQHHPELEEAARRRLYVSIHLHLMEMTMAGKKYWKHAKPLLKDLRENYSDMKRCLRQEGRSIWRLVLMRYLPYPIFYYIIRCGRRMLSWRKTIG